MARGDSCGKTDNLEDRLAGHSAAQVVDEEALVAESGDEFAVAKSRNMLYDAVSPHRQVSVPAEEIEDQSRGPRTRTPRGRRNRTRGTLRRVRGGTRDRRRSRLPWSGTAGRTSDATHRRQRRSARRWWLRTRSPRTTGSLETRRVPETVRGQFRVHRSARSWMQVSRFRRRQLSARSWNLRTLPVGVRGRSSGKTMSRGTLYPASKSAGVLDDVFGGCL